MSKQALFEDFHKRKEEHSRKEDCKMEFLLRWSWLLYHKNVIQKKKKKKRGSWHTTRQ